jgi:hypothetical protein
VPSCLAVLAISITTRITGSALTRRAPKSQQILKNPMKAHQYIQTIDNRLEAGPAAWRWFDWLGIVLIVLVGPSMLGYAMTDGLLWLAAHYLLGAASMYVALIWAASSFFYWLSGRRPQNTTHQSGENHP